MNAEPEPTALYRIFGDADLLLYIGISDDFGARWKRHAKAQPWWGERRRMTVDFYGSREEAAAAEPVAIKAERPKHNIVHGTAPRSPARKIPPAPAAVGVARPRRTIPPWPFLAAEDLDRMEPLAMLGGFRDYGLASDNPFAFCMSFRRHHARGARLAREMLADLWVVEQETENTDVIADLQSARRSVYKVAGIYCDRCGCVPPGGMKCLECGADGTPGAMPLLPAALFAAYMLPTADQDAVA